MKKVVKAINNLINEVRKIRMLLEKNLKENRKQTEWILKWKSMDENYHQKTLKKLTKKKKTVKRKGGEYLGI